MPMLLPLWCAEVLSSRRCWGGGGRKADVGKQPCLEVNHVAANTLGSFLHGLREGRVGVNVAADFLSGEVEALRQGQLWQQLGNVGAHHVAADELAVLAVRDELDKARGLIEACFLYTSPSPRD